MSKVYAIVTDYITRQLEAGTAPWKKGWTNRNLAPMNGVSGRRYSGVNYFMLSMMGGSPVWMTKNQIAAHGGTIKSTEFLKAMPIIFWSWLDKKNAVTGAKEKFPMLRFFNVWNLDQTENVKLPASVLAKLENPQAFTHDQSNELADAIIANMPNRPVVSETVSDKAFYSPTNDSITVPERSQFANISEFFSTMFHELAHSTGHKSRLNRKEVAEPSYFGSHDYSNEELVAELTASYLCAEAGIDNTLDNSAAYIAGWLGRLKSDPKAFVMAAGRAQKAADYILNRKPETLDTESES